MLGIDVAKKYLGLHENKDTKKLDDFISQRVPAWKGLHVNSTAWCAGFVGACEVEIGNTGTHRLNARSYEKYGSLATIPQRGDIVVFSRGGSSWQGHVAYVDGIERGGNGEKLVRTIGGNQSDSVSIGYYPMSRVLAFRRAP